LWLVDLNGGTIYAWGGGGQPVLTSLEYDLEVMVSPMPIPLTNNPLLLNFGGASPKYTLNWIISDANHYTGSAAGDWYQLTTNVQWGSSVAGYQLYMPELSTVGGTLSVQGFVTNLTLSFTGGQANAYTVSLVFTPGIVV
jgi:hypothetical protein